MEAQWCAEAEEKLYCCTVMKVVNSIIDTGREVESAKRVVDDMRRICVAMNSLDDFKSLFDLSQLMNQYLLKHCVERGTNPGSIKKYLYPFMDFCGFILI